MYEDERRKIAEHVARTKNQNDAVPLQTQTVQNIVENTPENVLRPPRAVHSQMPRPGSTTTQIADQNQSTVTPTVNPANPELNVPVTSSSAREEERPVLAYDLENPVDTQYQDPEAAREERTSPEEEMEEQGPSERIFESESISISTDGSRGKRIFSSSSRAVNISNPSTRPRTYSSSSRAIERMSENESEYSDAIGGIGEALENAAIATIARDLRSKFIFLRKI